MIVNAVDFDSLNAEQQSFAIADYDNPCFSQSAAGSGKTTAVVGRIQKMLEAGISPSNILLLSFTNAAANSIASRVKTLLPPDISGDITSGTFHGFFNSILRKYSALIGVPNDYDIKTDEIHNDIMALSIENTKNFPRGKGQPTSRKLLNLVANMKIRDLTLTDAIEIFYPFWMSELVPIKSALDFYFDYCKKSHILDYTDLLLKTEELFTKHPDVCETISNQYKYIIVDEYQDTNKIEANILKLLRSYDNKSLTVIGDINQSIYSFLNADVKNIINFPNEYQNTKEVPLTINYRSNQQILDLANAVVEKSKVGKFLPMQGVTSVNYKPFRCVFHDQSIEADSVIYTINKLHDDFGLDYNQIAVLARTGDYFTHLELALSSRDIQFVKRGGRKFLDTKQAQDVIQFFEVVAGSKSEISWIRTLCLFHNIGPVTSRKITREILKDPNNVDVQAMLGTKFQNTKYFKSCQDFVEIYEIATHKATPGELANYIVETYYSMMSDKYSDHTEEADRLEKAKPNLDVLANAASNFDTMRQFLDSITLDDSLMKDDADTNPDKLMLSTIHSAKGLEWEAVILIGIAEDYLPGLRNLVSHRPEAIEIRANEEEEGRRLLYVAITRAKKFLFVFRAKLKVPSYMFMKETPFFKDIDIDELTTEIPDDHFFLFVDNMSPSDFTEEPKEVY